MNLFEMVCVSFVILELLIVCMKSFGGCVDVEWVSRSLDLFGESM